MFIESVNYDEVLRTRETRKKGDEGNNKIVVQAT